MERFVPDRIVEVKEPDVVGTCIRTISRPDTPVVNLCVEALRRVRAGIGWADRFTRGVIAVLAKHGTELQTDIRKFPLPIPLDSHPVFGAPARCLVRTHGGDV